MHCRESAYKLAKLVGANVPPFRAIKVKDIDTSSFSEDKLNRWNEYIKSLDLNPDSEVLLTRDVKALSLEELSQRESSGLEERISPTRMS